VRVVAVPAALPNLVESLRLPDGSHLDVQDVVSARWHGGKLEQLTTFSPAVDMTYTHDTGRSKLLVTLWPPPSLICVFTTGYHSI